MFNYICNIHNSEAHLRSVMEGLKSTISKDSKVYCVLDGCTDGSEAIVGEYGFNKIYAPDVRETNAINIALESIPITDESYYFILQDDVVLLDPQTEEKMRQIFSKYPVGVLGLRHGVNLEPDVLTNGKHASEMDVIQNEFQPALKGIPLLGEGLLTERQVVYKSPICISGKVIKVFGGYDKRFYPIAHDDTEYCIRAINAGFKNYVYALDVLQPEAWGGTRRFTDVHSDNYKMHVIHMDLVRQLYPDTLKYLGNNHPPLTQFKI